MSNATQTQANAASDNSTQPFEEVVGVPGPDLPVGERPEDEKYSLGGNVAYGFQHVLTMYAGLMAVPLIIGQAAGLSVTAIGVLLTATFFMSGVATLLQTLGVKYIGSQLPIVQGVSFASVATIVAIATGGGGGITTIFGATIIAALIGFAISPYFSKLIRFFPPVVTGSVITVIGFSLIPVAAAWSMGGFGAPDFGSMSNIAVAGLTLLIAVLLSKVGSGTISRLSFLLAIILGTGIAFALGKADFSEVGEAAIFGLPNLFYFGLPTFNIAAIISMTIVILVIMTETSADILAIGEIVGTKVDGRRLGDGLRADMASSAVSPFFGSFPQSAFAQNVGLVAVTGIKSRYAVAMGGLILIALSLFPVLGSIVAAIPPTVLGGAGIILFSTVAAAGIRTLGQVDFDKGMNLIIVAVSIGVGLIPVVSPDFYADFPEWFQTIFDSGISAAAIVAVLLNLLFNHMTWGTPENPSVFVAGTSRQISPEVLNVLHDGDYCKDGKMFDCDDNEVPVVEKS